MDEPEAQRLAKIIYRELQLKKEEDIDVWRIGNGEYVCRICKPGRWYVYIWGVADWHNYKKTVA